MKLKKCLDCEKTLGDRRSQRCLKCSKKEHFNPMWKGERVGYKSLHQWVNNHLKKPEKCGMCKLTKKLDLANISQNYLRNLSDWEWLCRSCHMIKDERIKNLKQYKGATI